MKLGCDGDRLQDLCFPLFIFATLIEVDHRSEILDRLLDLRLNFGAIFLQDIAGQIREYVNAR